MALKVEERRIEAPPMGLVEEPAVTVMEVTPEIAAIWLATDLYTHYDGKSFRHLL